eukprot:scaffold11373_cov18-Tisochrysis_lutea.AAC.3
MHNRPTLWWTEKENSGGDSLRQAPSQPGQHWRGFILFPLPLPAGFARMRMEQQDARQASHYAASTSASTIGKGNTSSKGVVTAAGHPRTVYPSAMPAGVHAGAESSSSKSGRSRPVVELDPLYARRRVFGGLDVFVSGDRWGAPNGCFLLVFAFTSQREDKCFAQKRCPAGARMVFLEQAIYCLQMSVEPLYFLPALTPMSWWGWMCRNCCFNCGPSLEHMLHLHLQHLCSRLVHVVVPCSDLECVLHEAWPTDHLLKSLTCLALFRNPGVLEALRLMKRVVVIRGDGIGSLGEVEESWSGADDSDEDANEQRGEDGAG